MFAKLATVIVVLGAMFGALLVNRQQRIDAASEISRIHFRIERDARERARLEAEVAAAVRPDRIATMLERIARGEASPLRPIPFREDPASATDDALSTLDAGTGEGAEQELGG